MVRRARRKYKCNNNLGHSKQLRRRLNTVAHSLTVTDYKLQGSCIVTVINFVTVHCIFNIPFLR